jgi:hypothetical protein
MSFLFGRYNRYYTIATFLVGWYDYKSYGSYGKRHYHSHCELLFGLIPYINLLILPFLTGHALATLHDKLLYKSNPKHYQKLIQDYEKNLRFHCEAILTSSSDSGYSGGGHGNPQITYF